MGAERGEIWLVRHGETEWSRARRHTGKTDVPLSEEGERQAAAIGQLLAGRSFALVLVSPLRRARETCRIAGYEGPAQLRPDLAEWDYGAYEGRTTPEIREDVPGWTVWTHPVLDGETVELVGERASRILREAADAGGDVLVFGHGHSTRIATALWLGLPPADGKLFGLDTSTLSVLGHEHESRVLRLWNRAP